MNNKKLDSLRETEHWQLSCSVFEAIPDCVIVTDENGLIQMVNQSTLNCFGFEETALLEKRLTLLIPDQYTQQASLQAGHYKDSKPAQVSNAGRETMGIKQNGEMFPLYLSTGKFNVNGQHYFINICHDISATIKRQQQLYTRATRDSLTGCLNRSQFITQVEKAIEYCRRTTKSLALLFIDMEGFKHINDFYGHSIGDQLLARVAKRFRGCLRDNDLLGRVGGDEFVVGVILDDEQGLAVARRLSGSLKEPFSINGHTVAINANIGVSTFPSQATDAASLLENADMAMYYCKRDASDICVFRDDIQLRLDGMYRTRDRLYQALENNQLVLHYQPQFDLETLVPTSLEALLRWDDGGTLTYPREFVAIAQHFNLMPDITAWVIQQACKDNAELINSGLLDVPVSVNISTECFMAKNVHEQISKHSQQLPAGRLELEVPEDVIIDYDNAGQKKILALKEMGVSLALDNFGTGFSSLKRLRNLPLDKLKIDPSLLAMLPDRVGMLEGIITIAHDLGVTAVAGGIENRQQLSTLRSYGCEQGQGYLLAKPMSLPNLRHWLESSSFWTLQRQFAGTKKEGLESPSSCQTQLKDTH